MHIWEREHRLLTHTPTYMRGRSAHTNVESEVIRENERSNNSVNAYVRHAGIAITFRKCPSLHFVLDKHI